jgi:hypothetical protein
MALWSSSRQDTYAITKLHGELYNLKQLGWYKETIQTKCAYNGTLWIYEIFNHNFCKLGVKI